MERSKVGAIAAALWALPWALARAEGEAFEFRWSAPIEVRRADTFVEVPLPASAYGHSQQPELRDLRVVDVGGERVPFALLRPRAGERLDPSRALEVQVSPEAGTPGDESSERALHFDLGGALPVVQLNLRVVASTLIAPVWVQSRNSTKEPWRELKQWVFYRIEREGKVSESPPVSLEATVRYLRVVPDPRAGVLDAATTRLVVHAQLASVVFAMQGEPPFRLLAGSPTASPGPLSMTTLVPALGDAERGFGEATLGPWSEVAVERREGEKLRPWLLWAVLVVGVAGLGTMVWRLARGRG